MPYIVKSPVEGYSGISAGVQFKDGVGQTANTAAADWLKSHGYEVAEKQADKPDKAPPQPPEAPAPEALTPPEASTPPEAPAPEALTPPEASTPQEAPQPEAKAPAAANKGGGKKGGKA
jgi:hypothetical protein